MSSLSPAVRAALVSATAVGAAFGLSGCGALISALGGGNTLELAVGDCFIEDEMYSVGSDSEVTDVPLVDCSEEHDSEIYYLYDLEGDSFPGLEAARADADETCTAQAFTDFVGVEYAESEIYASYLVPTELSWNTADDREVVCYLFTDEMTTGSLEGANR
ncbi:septum formation family protein [Nocardiopsis sp. FIRDI 009]|uniref:septum formation family protein n=1 Tax=Nocardiopsis sp. FIRDI 009 TaxID=714197 RepID=UPI000E22E95E|nr:septum formation family protein [Nocardiopsis sp. FIRDI 009]